MVKNAHPAAQVRFIKYYKECAFSVSYDNGQLKGVAKTRCDELINFSQLTSRCCNITLLLVFDMRSGEHRASGGKS